MIQGVVSGHSEAIVKLRIRGPAGADRVVDAVIDTGFSAGLGLPSTTVAGLGLARHWSGTGMLADGSVRQFDVYAAEVEWDGSWRPVFVWAVGEQALLGMRLLARHELRIMVMPGGAVEISALP
jgi:clan AA aspartic protease